MFEDVDYDNLFVVGAISDFADDDGGPDRFTGDRMDLLQLSARRPVSVHVG